MVSRRKFLKTVSVGAIAPSVLLAQQGEKQPELRRSRWELLFANPEIAPVQFRPNPKAWDPSTITIAWIGHSTVLINFFGTIILTDPVLVDRIGINILGLMKIGPKRLVEPALNFDELPKIDLILLSHAHMDHLDVQTLQKFKSDIPFVMAKNTADVIDGLAIKTVYEIDWGEKRKILDLDIEAIRTKHFGWRYPWEEDRSRGNWDGRSFNAYLITKNGHSILFGGDTAYQEYFKELSERGVKIDIALLPIGAYDPWIHNHCDPEQALQMAQHIHAQYLLPIHWGTFIQSDEPTHEPIERLQKAIQSSSVVLGWEAHGQTWQLNQNLTEDALTEHQNGRILKYNNTAGWSNW